MNKNKIDIDCDYVVREYFKGVPVKEAIEKAKVKFQIENIEL